MLLAFVCRTRNETGVSGHGGSEMDSKAITPASNTNLAPGAVPLVSWREALDTFLNTLSSPRTAKAYRRAVIDAMEALEVDYVIDVTPPMLAQYRGGLVSRLDTDVSDRPSPSTVNLKLVGLRQFLRFCMVTGIARLREDAIAFVLKPVRATVEKPYQLFSTRQSERMTPERARQLVKALARKANIKKPTGPRGLHPKMAIETLREGASPVVIQKLLGHAYLAPTTR
jgi:site-specific recombinase XerD